MKQIFPFKGRYPQLDASVYVAPGAMLSGDITAGEGCAFWYNAVVRADVNPVRIGKYTNIQDNAVVHEDSGNNTGHEGGTPTIIGDYVTVGHNAIIHGCTIEDYVLIGMGAIVMDGAVVGHGSVIGAGAVVTKYQQIPPYSLVMGIPAKVVRTLDEKSATADGYGQAMHHHSLAQEHRKNTQE